MSAPRHVKRDYESSEIIVHWDSSKCVHCANCVRGLPAVFDTNRSPWIDVSGASAEEIVRQVEQCPSGALTASRKSSA